MVAEHRYETMAMNTFLDSINELETTINVQDPASATICDLFKLINSGFQVIHKQVSDINDKLTVDDAQHNISNLDQVTQHINTNLHTPATQVAQHQAVQGPQQHNTGIF